MRPKLPVTKREKARPGHRYVGLDLSPPVYNALAEAARLDIRPVSSQVAWIIKKWIDEHGSAEVKALAAAPMAPEEIALIEKSQSQKNRGRPVNPNSRRQKRLAAKRAK